MTATPTAVRDEADPPIAGSGGPVLAGSPTARRWVMSWPFVALVRLSIVVVVLAAWQYLPRIDGVAQRSNFLDPYFISSPSRILTQLVNLVTGDNGGPLIWPYMWPTFGSAILGTVGGLILGGALGLFLGSFRFAGKVFRPFVVVLNAVPRIALIPIIIVIMGAGMVSSTVIAIMVVFFVALFNAQEGARTVERHVLDNVRLQGANGWDVMWRVRFPYALAWTLSSLPVAVSFAIVSVVSGEILIGGGGLGSVMSVAAVSANADLTFAVIVFLAVFALTALGIAELFKRRVLRWWLSNSDD